MLYEREKPDSSLLLISLNAYVQSKSSPKDKLEIEKIMAIEVAQNGQIRGMGNFKNCDGEAVMDLGNQQRMISLERRNINCLLTEEVKPTSCANLSVLV